MAVVPLINSPVFHNMVANANNLTSLAAATAYLVDALEYVDAPPSMCDYHTAFEYFLSFFGQPDHATHLSPALCNALQMHKHKAKAQINEKQWLVHHVGLDWKSGKQMARCDLYLQRLHANHLIVAPYWITPYPPAGHWIAETQSIHNKWLCHLTNPGCKKHDKCIPDLPIHILIPEELMRDIGPDEDAYIVDENGM